MTEFVLLSTHGLPVVVGLGVVVVDEELVICLKFLDLDHGVDHLGCHSLAAHELVHLLLCLELCGLESFYGVDALLSCQFNGRSIAELVPE